MPGLPLGAAQQHDVPVELLDYDHIAGIEYIETNAGIPYPRSVAYRPVDGGGQMRVRDKAPDLVDIDLDEAQARAYIDAVVSGGVFGWNRVYRPAQGTFVFDGTNWRLEVTFKKTGVLKAPRPFRVEGEMIFPDNYEQVVGLLMGPALEELAQRRIQGEQSDEAGR